jgi:hypothetical protein
MHLAFFSVNVGLTVKRLKPDIKLVFTLHYHGSGHSIIRSALWFLWRRYVAKLIDTSLSPTTGLIAG